MPIETPPSRNSDCLIKPVLNAIAFGGVDTGSNKAQEALSAITKGNTAGLKSPLEMLINDKAIGTKIVVAAVLLIKFDNNTVIKPNSSINK